MANDLNQCNFIGRVGQDPEIRYTPSGSAIASFSIAVGWKSTDKEGTEWVKLTAFNKLAEVCEKYIRKGSKVFVSGKFKTDAYEKDGIKHYSTKIIIDQMQMLDSKPKDAAPQQQRETQSKGFDNQPDFDDIPF